MHAGRQLVGHLQHADHRVLAVGVEHGGVHRAQVDLAGVRGARWVERGESPGDVGQLHPHRAGDPPGARGAVHRRAHRAGVEVGEERVAGGSGGQLDGRQGQAADERVDVVVAVEVRHRLGHRG